MSRKWALGLRQVLCSFPFARTSSISSRASATRSFAMFSTSNSNNQVWVGRPFESSQLGAPDKDLTTNVPAPVKVYQQDPQDVMEQRSNFYKEQFQQRISEHQAQTQISSRTVTAPNGHEVGVTIFMPRQQQQQQQQQQLKGVCLHVHGGGWVFGDSKHQAATRLLEMAETLQCAVVSVEYRMGPQNRHPAAVQDVAAVQLWLAQNAQVEFGTNVLVASGESAGAHLLTLATLHVLKKSKNRQQQPFRCLNLVYGVYDLSGTPSLLADGDSSAPLCGKELRWMVDLYVPDSDKNVDLKDPDLSPLYANLQGMPPALFSVGTADPLLDDTLFMANRYGAAGCQAELAVYQGGEHGIGHFGMQENIPLGLEARKRTLEFLQRFL